MVNLDLSFFRKSKYKYTYRYIKYQFNNTISYFVLLDVDVLKKSSATENLMMDHNMMIDGWVDIYLFNIIRGRREHHHLQTTNTLQLIDGKKK